MQRVTSFCTAENPKTLKKRLALSAYTSLSQKFAGETSKRECCRRGVARPPENQRDLTAGAIPPRGASASNLPT